MGAIFKFFSFVFHILCENRDLRVILVLLAGEQILNDARMVLSEKKNLTIQISRHNYIEVLMPRLEHNL